MPEGPSLEASLGSQMVLERHRSSLVEIVVLDATFRLINAAILIYVASASDLPWTRIAAAALAVLVAFFVWTFRGRILVRRARVFEEQIAGGSAQHERVTDLFIASWYRPHGPWLAFRLATLEPAVWLVASGCVLGLVGVIGR